MLMLRRACGTLGEGKIGGVNCGPSLLRMTRSQVAIKIALQ